MATDFGYEFILSRYLEATAIPGSCLLAIGTSGQSRKIIKASEYANLNGIGGRSSQRMLR